MRDTVPEGGLLDAGRSEEVFTGLLDQHIASVAATRSGGSLADALYRQFVGRVAP
jgi:Rod binding domain-containing protein